MKHLNLFLLTLMLCFASQAQVTKYAKPDAANNGNGTQGNPYKSIAAAVTAVNNSGQGGTVIILNGTYDMGSNGVTITTVASSDKAITIEPESAGEVTLKFTGRFGFEFTSDSRYIILKGLELYGQTDLVDYWTIVAKGVWFDPTVAKNGGLAVKLNGQHIDIIDNYIHDWYQKAVEIRDGRYVNVQGNIIHNIATTALSGGHGIMRQQKGVEYDDDDTDVNGNLLYYRWQIKENLLFRVEQRIYSWVPKKGFMEMTIDEGKSILIDDPKNGFDFPGQENMKALIKNNIVAYGAVDAIRIKATPGLEVSNNSVYQEGPNADGITDKKADAPPTPTGGQPTLTPIRFTDFTCKNNAVQTNKNIFAIAVKTAQTETTNNGTGYTVNGNYAMHGKIKPSGITRETNASLSLFTNPSAGDFSIKSSLNLPATLGVTQSVRDNITTKTGHFGVTVGPDANYVHDNLKLSQTIFDNIPGVDDGTANNETRFANHGSVVLTGLHPHILYNVVNGPWKTDTESPNKQKFQFNAEYLTWYTTIKAAHPGSGSGYDRYRWGSSEIMQNHVFPSNWLTATQINGLNDHTSINGHDKKLTLGGDILIDFGSFTPSVGDHFDLMVANEIVPESPTGNAFNNILFDGFTPAYYTLKVVQDGGNDVLRLAITAPLSVDDQTLNTTTLKVVPNPTNGVFVLETKNAIKHIKLYDVLGREVTNNTTITPVTNGYKFNVTQLAKGIYILQADQQSIKVMVK